MRASGDRYVNGKLYDGYDYKNQAWVRGGKYVRCGHAESMICGCFGKVHEGEQCEIGCEPGSRTPSSTL